MEPVPSPERVARIRAAIESWTDTGLEETLEERVQTEVKRLRALGAECEATPSNRIYTSKKLPARAAMEFLPVGIVDLYKEYLAGIEDADRFKYAQTKLRRYCLIPDRAPGGTHDARAWVPADLPISDCFEHAPKGAILILADQPVD
jgi:hypothetical protein